MKRHFKFLIGIQNTLILILAISIILLSHAQNKETALAMDVQDEFDEKFIQAISEICDIKENSEVVASKQTIFDLELRTLGYAYSFMAIDNKGYAIVVSDKEKGNIVTEVVLDAESPFLRCDGIGIYIAEMNYLDYFDGKYRVLGTSSILEYNDIANIYTHRYCGSGGELQMNETTVSFVSKSNNNYSLAKRVPSYATKKFDNPCVSIASANIIAYFDRYKENLIPDYTPGKGIGNLYLYNKQNITIENLIGQIYGILNPGKTSGGNTIAEFKWGMDRYCRDHGYNVVFENCPTVDYYNNAKDIFLEGKPLVMFMDRIEFCLFSETSNKDTIKTYNCDIKHAMCGFGYKEIEYILQDNSIETERYLLVATGIDQYPLAYFNVNSIITIHDIYAVDIY